MKMPFGKYVNKDMEDIPSSYLRWLIDDLDEQKNADLIEAADEELAFRDAHGGHF